MPGEFKDACWIQADGDDMAVYDEMDNKIKCTMMYFLHRISDGHENRSELQYEWFSNLLQLKYRGIKHIMVRWASYGNRLFFFAIPRSRHFPHLLSIT